MLFSRRLIDFNNDIILEVEVLHSGFWNKLLITSRRTKAKDFSYGNAGNFVWPFLIVSFLICLCFLSDENDFEQYSSFHNYKKNQLNCTCHPTRWFRIKNQLLDKSVQWVNNQHDRAIQAILWHSSELI